MRSLFSNAGRAFLIAFGAALLIYVRGFLSAPTLHDALLLGFSALLASVAAGITAIQTFVPRLTFAKYLADPYGRWADSFVHGFLGTLVVTLPDALGSPDLHTLRALVVAAIVGAVAAGIRALVGAFTIGESPNPRRGLRERPVA